MMTDRDNLSYRRSAVVAPKTTTQFNQFLPSKDKATGYVPAPLRKKRAERNDDNRRSLTSYDCGQTHSPQRSVRVDHRSGVSSDSLFRDYDDSEDSDDEVGHADPVQDDLYTRKMGTKPQLPALSHDKFLPKFWTPEEDIHIQKIKLGSQKRPWYKKMQGLRLIHSPVLEPPPLVFPPVDPTSGPKLVKCERWPLYGRQDPREPPDQLDYDSLYPDLENDDMFARRTLAFQSNTDLAMLKLPVRPPRYSSEPQLNIVTRKHDRNSPEEEEEKEEIFPDIEEDDVVYRKEKTSHDQRPLSGAPDNYNPMPIPEPWTLPPELKAKLLCPPCPLTQEVERDKANKLEKEMRPDTDDMLVRKLEVCNRVPLTNQKGPPVPSTCSEEDLQKWQTIRKASQLKHRKKMTDWLCFFVNSDIVKKKEEREKIEEITYGSNRKSKTFKEMQEDRAQEPKSLLLPSKTEVPSVESQFKRPQQQIPMEPKPPVVSRVSASLPRTYQGLDSARLTSVIAPRPFGTQATRLSSLPRANTVNASVKPLNGDTSKKSSVPSRYHQFMTSEDEAQSSSAHSSDEEEEEEEVEDSAKKSSTSPTPAETKSETAVRPAPVKDNSEVSVLNTREDFCEMRISLNQKPNSSRDFGFQAAWDSTGARVTTIAPGSPAEMCQLQTGDEVLTVNGHQVAGMSYTSWKTHIEEALQEGSLVMDIKRHGKNSESSAASTLCLKCLQWSQSGRSSFPSCFHVDSEPISLKNLKRRSEFFEQGNIPVPPITTTSSRWSFDPEEERKRQEKWQKEQDRLLQEQERERKEEQERRRQAEERELQRLREERLRREQQEEEERKRREEEEIERKRRIEEEERERKRRAEEERRREEEERERRRAEEERIRQEEVRRREEEERERRRRAEEEKRRQEEVRRREDEEKERRRRAEEAAEQLRRERERILEIQQRQQQQQQQWSVLSQTHYPTSTPPHSSTIITLFSVNCLCAVMGNTVAQKYQQSASQAELERQQILNEMKKKTPLLTDNSWIRQPKLVVLTANMLTTLCRGESLDNLDSHNYNSWRSSWTPRTNSQILHYLRPQSAMSGSTSSYGGWSGGLPRSSTLPSSSSLSSLRGGAGTPSVPWSRQTPSPSLSSPSPTTSPESVSGKKICTYCDTPLGKGAAMIIESLGLCYHLGCFKCFDCGSDLGGSEIGAEVRIRNKHLYCNNCYVRFKSK
uniref:Uncharacterized protein n=1 Tax=Periophthalmus magnuspinnatus TaxID=409849 RepID=A0A3B3Z974_9GOBI